MAARASGAWDEVVLDLLESDEHHDVPAAETHEVGTETLIKGHWAFLCDHLAHDRKWRLARAGLDVHNARFQHIDGRTTNDSSEASAERAGNVRENVVWHAPPIGHLFELIVRGELGSIDDGVANNVGAHTDPEALHAVLCIRLSVAVHRIFVRTFRRGQLALTLHSHFDEISGVGDRDADGSSCHAGRDLLEKGGVLARRHLSTEDVSDGHVQTDTDSSEDELTLKTRCNSTPQSEWSLICYNGLHCAEHAFVHWLLTWGGLLNLKTDFGGVEGNGADLSCHTRC